MAAKSRMRIAMRRPRGRPRSRAGTWRYGPEVVIVVTDLTQVVEEFGGVLEINSSPLCSLYKFWTRYSHSGCASHGPRTAKEGMPCCFRKHFEH